MTCSRDNLLKCVRFSNLSRWTAASSVFESLSVSDPLVPLFKVLRRVKEPVDIDDSQNYKRITVKLYGLGVHLRDEVSGREIGTKRQFRAHAGQLIISRIDARNGAFGIVPESLEGAVVTNDFWLFDIERAVPDFLTLVLSSELFQQHWKSQSSGTTNRQRIDESGFMNSLIALPPIERQSKLLSEYNQAVSEAAQLERTAALRQEEITEYLLRSLNIKNVCIPNHAGLLRVASFSRLDRKWEWDSLTEAIETALKDCRYPVKNLDEAVSFVNRSWKKGSVGTDKFMYIEIGGIDSDANTAQARELLVTDAPSRATQRVKTGDLIIGTTRPYLKRFAIIRDCEDGYVCSSGFQIIEAREEYDLGYVLEVLKLDPVIKQFESLMTGALYPAVNSEQLKRVKIPLPPVCIQKELSANILRKKAEILSLLNQADDIKKAAKRAFENAVFGLK